MTPFPSPSARRARRRCRCACRRRRPAKGGPWVCTATRSSRAAMSSSVPALAVPVIPNRARPATNRCNLHLVFPCCVHFFLLSPGCGVSRRPSPENSFSTLPGTVSHTVIRARSIRRTVDPACVSGLSRPDAAMSRRASIAPRYLPDSRRGLIPNRPDFRSRSMMRSDVTVFGGRLRCREDVRITHRSFSSVPYCSCGPSNRPRNSRGLIAVDPGTDCSERSRAASAAPRTPTNPASARVAAGTLCRLQRSSRHSAARRH